MGDKHHKFYQQLCYLLWAHALSNKYVDTMFGDPLPPKFNLNWVY